MGIDNKLKLSDLCIGMKVNTMQLSDIYDTYILLSQTELSNKNDGSTDGIIEFISKKQTTEMKEAFDKCIAKYGRRPMIYAHTRLEDGIYSV